jgi:hypothetical protein
MASRPEPPNVRLIANPCNKIVAMVLYVLHGCLLLNPYLLIIY